HQRWLRFSRSATNCNSCSIIATRDEPLDAIPIAPMPPKFYPSEIEMGIIDGCAMPRCRYVSVIVNEGFAPRGGSRHECRPEGAQPDTPTEPLEREVQRVGQHGARRFHHHYLLGNRREISAEMHGALEPQNAGGRGLDPKVPKDRLIGRLDLARRGDDSDPTNAQERHRAKLHVGAAIDRSGGGKLAISNGFDNQAAAEWMLPGGARLAPEVEGKSGPLPGRVRGCGRRWVPHHGQGGVRDFSAPESLEQPDRVRGSASA